MSDKALNDFFCSSLWRPGLYKFYGSYKPCWYRTIYSINGFKDCETLSQYGVTRHRSVKFHRYLRRIPFNECVAAHDKLRELSGEFEYKKEKSIYWLNNPEADKTLVRQKIEAIRRLSEEQDKIFNTIVKFLKIEEDEFKKEWLFDAAFNGADFDLIWKNKLK